MAQVEEEEHWEDAKETMDLAATSSSAAPSAAASSASASSASASASAAMDNEADDAAGDADGWPAAPEAEPEPVYTEEARKRMDEEAMALKDAGNQLFGRGEWEAALEKYAEAVAASPRDSKNIAIFKANAAACRIKQEKYDDAVKLCTEALQVDNVYAKALLRRAQAHEKLAGLEHLTGALDDYKRLVELDPANTDAKAKVPFLEPRVEEERQKQMQEMLGKVKELGNMFLGKFGLSTDNFKMDKDPNTGSYSVSFVK